MANSEDGQAKYGLGLTTLSALVVANMIGAGVFTSSGFALAALGNPGRVLLAWCLCGIWALCGAVAYGALARRLPLSGGEYLFLSRLVHPAVGFLAGWISVVAGFTAPIAVAAQGAAFYSLAGASEGDVRLTQLAVAVIVLATLCHLIGISLGAGLQNLIVAAKLLLLAVIIVWAFLFTSSETWQGAALPDRASGWWPEDGAAWTLLVGSMSWIALSYTGFNAAIYVAGESRNARQTVPRAMLWATVVVTVIYLLLNTVFVYAPPPEAIANQERVASIAARVIGGARLEWLVRVTIVLAMVSSVFAMLMAGPRVYQKMAEDGVMPRIFHAGGGAPRLATLVQAGLSMVAVFVADLLQLMKYLGLTLSACGALAVFSLWWARRRVPGALPLRWWETLAMCGYLFITLCILWASRETHADEFFAMVITFALGIVVYGLWNWYAARQAEDAAETKPLPRNNS
ncbi:MAG: APC family permease [Planctomycetales bacterium]|nr:APC family permease [Planctomycetales bacterium]